MFWADRVQDHRTRSLRLRIHHWCFVVTQSQSAWTVFRRFGTTLSSPSCCCSLHSLWRKFKRCTACLCKCVYIAYIFSLFCVLSNKKEFMNFDSVLQTCMMSNKLFCTLYPVLLLPWFLPWHTLFFGQKCVEEFPSHLKGDRVQNYRTRRGGVYVTDAWWSHEARRSLWTLIFFYKHV